MMKDADLRDRYDASGRQRLDFSRARTVIAERLMGTRRVVVSKVRSEQAAEMPLVEHDEVVEAFPPNRADHPFGEGILPRSVRSDENLVHSHAVNAAVKGVAIDRIAIAEEIPWDCFVGERVSDLLSGPGGGGVVGDIDV